MTVVRPAIAALACLVVAGCNLIGSGSARATFPKGSTMARIQAHDVLTVGIKFDQPAFGYKDPSTGRILGFDAEIARLVARDITGSDRKIRFVETVSRNREEFLRRGVVDMVIATYSITAERSKLVDFAGPYYYAGQDILVRTADKRVRKVSDLAGKRVCTATGSTSVTRLQSVAPKARLVVVDTYSQCIPALKDGRIDAISTDDTILLGLMNQTRGTARLVGRPFSKEPYGIGIPHGDSVLRDYLNGLIRRYLRDGSWDRAYRDTISAVDTPATVSATPSAAPAESSHRPSAGDVPSPHRP
jgi:glutamate transport system substrate-binding protein